MSRFLKFLISSSRVFAMTALLATGALTSNVAAQAAAERPAATNPAIEWRNVKTALDAPVGSFIYVKANLVSVSAPRPESRQPWSLYVNDATGTIRVVIFQDTWSRIPDTSFLEPGTRLDLYAKIGEYRGERQLEISQPNHFRRTPGTVATGGAALRTSRDGTRSFSLISIGSLNITHVGQPVRVRGEVVKYQESDNDRLPFRVTIKDESDQVEGLFWKSVADAISPENRPVVGQQIELSGIGSEFRGGIQVRVDEPQFISRTFQVNARTPQLTNGNSTARAEAQTGASAPSPTN